MARRGWEREGFGGPYLRVRQSLPLPRVFLFEGKLREGASELRGSRIAVLPVGRKQEMDVCFFWDKLERMRLLAAPVVLTDDKPPAFQLRIEIGTSKL